MLECSKPQTPSGSVTNEHIIEYQSMSHRSPYLVKFVLLRRGIILVEKLMLNSISNSECLLEHL